jgi:tRNA (guanine37-N1)-methyltransferase
MSIDFMKYIRVAPKSANKAKVLITRLKLFDGSRAVIHSRSYVYFPTLDIKHAKSIKLIGRLGAAIVERKEGKVSKAGSYEQQLASKISKDELTKLSKGYDQIGSIAIIEFKGKRANERKIARLLIQSNNSIKTVLAKAGAVSGKYRIRKLRYVAGIKDYMANYRENECIFRFDIRKVYFSNRLSFERSRILKLAKKGENVMVMFAGVGPFAIEIARNIKDTNIVAIELNKSAYNYMLASITLNKLNNVKAVCGDVKKEAKNYGNFADRVIMPLPKSSLEFLDQVHKVAKKNAVVHLYAFSELDDPFSKICNKIVAHSKKKRYTVKIMNKRIVRPYSTKECEVVIDYSIKKK